MTKLQRKHHKIGNQISRALMLNAARHAPDKYDRAYFAKSIIQAGKYAVKVAGD